MSEQTDDWQRFEISAADQGVRLDVFLSSKFSEHSRVQVRKAIDAQHALVDGKSVKASFRLSERQEVLFKPEFPRDDGPRAEAIPLEIIYEDEALAVINKPAGMVVHPAKGHWSGTLVAALKHHFDQLSQVGGEVRPGIVHRLDRDTTGLIVVARHDQAHLKLAKQFEARTVEKEYLAVVCPPPDRDRDWIEASIGPHSSQREKMAIRESHPASRSARTFYQVLNRWGRYGLVQAEPKTGRTHQIRVHLSHIGSPVVADRLYGHQGRLTIRDVYAKASEDRVVIDRQALHAHRIRFQHPTSGKTMEFEAPLAKDMQDVLDLLERGNAN